MSTDAKIDQSSPWPMYYVDNYGRSRIDRVLVYKETRMFVTLRSVERIGRVYKFYRVKKDVYFDTFEEAKMYLVGRQIGRVEKDKANLLRAKKRLADAEALTEADCDDR